MIIIITYVVSVMVFIAYHDHIRGRLAALAMIPVIGASWYFGIPGGVLTAILSALVNDFIVYRETQRAESGRDEQIVLGRIVFY